MSGSSLQTQAIEAIMAINAAIRNMRLYPSGSAIIEASLEKAHQTVMAILAQAEHVIYAEAEKVLIVDEQPLSEKALQKPQVRAFLETMLESGIRALSFHRGLEKYELLRFLQIITSSADEVTNQGGLEALVKRRNLPHIHVDEKRFIALDKGQRIVAAVSDDQHDTVQRPSAAETTQPGGGEGERENRSRVLYSGLQPFADLAQGGQSADTQVVFDQLLTQLAGVGADGRPLSGDGAATAAESVETPAGRSVHIRSAVQRILKGERLPFEDGVVVEALPRVMQQLAAKGKSNFSDALLDSIGQAMADPTPAIRSNAATALTQVLPDLPAEHQATTTQRLLPQIIAFAEHEDGSSPAAESLFSQIKAVVQAHVRSQRYAAANQILEALEKAAAGSAFAGAMGRLSRSLIEAIAEEWVILSLVQAHQQTSEEMQPVIAETLRWLLPASAGVMLEQLRTVEVRSARSHLLRLLPELGEGLRPEVLQRIQDAKPWYYLRNLAALLGKVGTAEDLPVLEGLLGHDDPRIQREALGSLYNVGGEGRGEIMLGFLDRADESIKINVVAMLGALAYGPSVPALIELLESRSARTGKEGEALSEKICAALAHIADPAAVPGLEKILQPRGLLARGPSERVGKAIRQALVQIRSAPRPPAASVAPPAADPTPPTTDPAETNEAEIDRLAAAGNTEAAVQKLLTRITTEAKAKRFVEAERLRDKIYEIDAMALGPIIQAGEIIEAEKSGAIDSDHLRIFAPLYALLTETERNDLYHAMAPVAFSSGESIVDQGRDNDRLYFINQGQVKLVHRRGTREMLIDRMAAGSIAGTESFFKATLTTVSAVALEPVEASSITRSGLDALHPDHPGLKAKLQEYATRLDTTADQLRRREMDRRRHKRFNIQGRVRIQLQDRQRRPVGRPFLGVMADYAIGGVAFCIGSTRSETARILLGRRVQLDFVLPVPEPMGKVSVAGTVIAVNDLLANEYSLHVRFDQDMDPAIAEALDTSLRKDA